jgi:hypothetical protein
MFKILMHPPPFGIVVTLAVIHSVGSLVIDGGGGGGGGGGGDKYVKRASAFVPG